MPLLYTKNFQATSYTMKFAAFEGEKPRPLMLDYTEDRSVEANVLMTGKIFLTIICQWYYSCNYCCVVDNGILVLACGQCPYTDHNQDSEFVMAWCWCPCTCPGPSLVKINANFLHYLVIRFLITGFECNFIHHALTKNRKLVTGPALITTHHSKRGINKHNIKDKIIIN